MNAISLFSGIGGIELGIKDFINIQDFEKKNNAGTVPKYKVVKGVF